MGALGAPLRAPPEAELPRRIEARRSREAARSRGVRTEAREEATSPLVVRNRGVERAEGERVSTCRREEATTGVEGSILQDGIEADAVVDEDGNSWCGWRPFCLPGPSMTAEQKIVVASRRRKKEE